MADSKTLCRVFAVASPPLVPTAPPLPRCEACHWIFGSLCSPTNPVPLPPRCAGGTITRAMLRATYRIIASRSFIVPPLAGGKVVAPATKGGLLFSPARAVCLFSHGRSPVLKVFFILRRRRHHNPRAKGASNLSSFRTFGPKGRQPARP